MKPWHFAFLILALSVASPAFAQSSAHGHETSTDAAPVAGFEQLKTLAGSWVGQLTTIPAVPAATGNFVQFSLRVTSRGNALVHEMSVSGLPDHPLTMFYLDAGRMTLTHYCDAGNRPRMVGTLSPDGKTVEFDFLDLSGGNERGHMHHAVFTFVDANHHTEDWTYMMPGDVPMRAHFALQRTNFEGGGTH
ncbi:MAG TPA: hypothetical protein VN654_13675 [Vicinamibacterales bacterium]|jgi:hypothetical protein|nr:hypothetical protein [Vicinamibacterales bacterium]